MGACLLIIRTTRPIILSPEISGLGTAWKQRSPRLQWRASVNCNQGLSFHPYLAAKSKADHFGYGRVFYIFLILPLLACSKLLLIFNFSALNGIHLALDLSSRRCFIFVFFFRVTLAMGSNASHFPGTSYGMRWLTGFGVGTSQTFRAYKGQRKTKCIISWIQYLNRSHDLAYTRILKHHLIVYARMILYIDHLIMENDSMTIIS